MNSISNALVNAAFGVECAMHDQIPHILTISTTMVCLQQVTCLALNVLFKSWDSEKSKRVTFCSLVFFTYRLPPFQDRLTGPYFSMFTNLYHSLGFKVQQSVRPLFVHLSLYLAQFTQIEKLAMSRSFGLGYQLTSACLVGTALYGTYRLISYLHEASLTPSKK